jgi:predicted phosphodiesterase
VRSLILSDIHGNGEALDAVLEDARGRYDEIVCLGDLVGYGASPGKIIDWVRANARAVVRGNHDKAVAGLDPMEDFNLLARLAVRWTQEQLTPEQLDYLKGLPEGPLMYDDVELAHGSPEDEDEYLLNAIDVESLTSCMKRRVCFIGHTHMQGGFTFEKGRPERLVKPRASATEAVLQIKPDVYYLLNPGSVGQPRDADPRAAYAVYDSGAQTVIYRRVNYQIDEAQRRILRAGLPELLASRLALGR